MSPALLLEEEPSFQLMVPPSHSLVAPRLLACRIDGELDTWKEEVTPEIWRIVGDDDVEEEDDEDDAHLIEDLIENVQLWIHALNFDLPWKPSSPLSDSNIQLRLTRVESTSLLPISHAQHQRFFSEIESRQEFFDSLDALQYCYRHLPHIYFIWHALLPELEYIGESSNVPSRLAGHDKLTSESRVGTYAIQISFSSSEEVLPFWIPIDFLEVGAATSLRKIAEAMLIQHLQPTKNSIHLSTIFTLIGINLFLESSHNIQKQKVKLPDVSSLRKYMTVKEMDIELYLELNNGTFINISSERGPGGGNWQASDKTISVSGKKVSK